MAQRVNLDAMIRREDFAREIKDAPAPEDDPGTEYFAVAPELGNPSSATKTRISARNKPLDTRSGGEVSDGFS